MCIRDRVVDAAGLYMIPGLVDIHFHGCKGADMCDGTQEALDIITAYEMCIRDRLCRGKGGCNPEGCYLWLSSG